MEDEWLAERLEEYLWRRIMRSELVRDKVIRGTSVVESPVSSFITRLWPQIWFGGEWKPALEKVSDLSLE